MTDRQTVLQAASQVAHFDEDFDMDLVYRLQDSMHSSVDTLALYGLSRVHAWLWPLLKDLPLANRVQIGPFEIVAAEKDAATSRDQSKQSFYAHASGNRWKLAWFGMEGKSSGLGVGVDPDGFFSVAYCEFRDSDKKAEKGGVTGRGSEITSLFDFLTLAGAAMPADVRNVGAAALARSWEFDDIEDIVAFDNSMGATFGAELHGLAEQRASKMLCDIAASNVINLVTALQKHVLVHDKEFLRSKNSVLFAIEGVPSKPMAYYSERFPGGEGDRYINWCDTHSNGSIIGFNTYVLPPDKLVSEAITDFADGRIEPSCSHDFASGKTMFGDTVRGYTHLASATIYLHHDAHLVLSSDTDDWERSTHFDDLDEHIVHARNRGLR